MTLFTLIKIQIYTYIKLILYLRFCIRIIIAISKFAILSQAIITII